MPAIDQLPLADLLRLTPEKIVAWFEAKGVTVSWDWREVWQQANAVSFTVAKATQLDVLADLRTAVGRVFSEGTSLEQFKRNMETAMKARGWWGRSWAVNPKTGMLEKAQLGSAWRLETIYRTNAQSGFQKGRYEQQMALARSRPFWQYVAVMDSRTRPTHAALHGKIWPATSAVWRRIYPPNGFNCRCRVRAYTPAELARKGLRVEPDETLPEGFPDEGFDYSPGDSAPLPERAPPTAAVPPELRDEPMTAQLAGAVDVLQAATERAIAAGIPPDVVFAVALQAGAIALPPKRDDGGE